MVVFSVLFLCLIILFLIVTHELGHYIAAKLCGCSVSEFSVGFGPALWKRERNGTLYALRAIPLGGFCAIEGENLVTKKEGKESLLCNRPVRQQLVVFLAGIVTNFVTGLLMVGSSYLLFGKSFFDGVLVALGSVVLMLSSLWQLAIGQVSGSDVGGLLSLVVESTKYASLCDGLIQTIGIMLLIGGVLAVNLAIINSLPIPALDGGRVFLVILNKISLLTRKKPLSERFQLQMIKSTNAFIVGAMVFLLLKDFFSIF